MTEGGRVGNAIRAVLVPRLHLVPGLKDQILSSQTPALHRSELALRPRLGPTLAGSPCPNAVLDDGRRFDEVTASRFAVVTCDQPDTTQRAGIARRGAVLLTARPGTPLHRWLQRGRARAAIIRPDGTVLRAGRRLRAVCAALPDFSGTHLDRPRGEHRRYTDMLRGRVAGAAAPLGRGDRLDAGQPATPRSQPKHPDSSQRGRPAGSAGSLPAGWSERISTRSRGTRRPLHGRAGSRWCHRSCSHRCPRR